MMLTTVYDAKGAPFEVREADAKRLLGMGEGWSTEAPEPATAPATDTPDHD
jgi:hypothetical protein